MKCRNKRLQGLTAFIICVATAVYCQREQFYGGSMSYTLMKNPSGKQTVKFELITGWVFEKGPCGPQCAPTDIGKSTKISRQQVLNVYDNSWLGYFNMHCAANLATQQEMTSIVLSNYTETVIGLSLYGHWEQELLLSSFQLPENMENCYLNYDGHSWKSLSLQARSDNPLDSYWHFQVKISTSTRNDTGQANQSPRSFVKPYYRVKLGEIAAIPIPAIDADGDFISCNYAQYVEGGYIATHPPPHVTIEKNCTIYINASEANGYQNDTWIGVPVIVSDYNVKNIIFGTDQYAAFRFSLSQTPVQFLVQVLAQLSNPVFAEPTEEGNHVFILYADATWRTKVYAEAPAKTTIAEFKANGIDNEVFNLSSPLEQDNLRTQVKYVTISWKPSIKDVGSHIACVQAIDDTGMDSADMRCFILDVKAQTFNYSTGKTPGKPYFVDIPSPNQFVTCQLQATCVVPLFVHTDLQLKDIRIVSTDLFEAYLGPIESVTHQGVHMYKADLSVQHIEGGKYNVCFLAEDLNRTFSDTTCAKIKIAPRDPCISIPCKNGGECVQDEDSDTFTCQCREKYYGKLCEIKDDPCKPDMCVPGQSVMCVGLASILCYCKKGWTGRYCESSINDCPVNNTCNGHGSCLDKHLGYQCNCFSRYNGTNCEIDKCPTQAIGEITCSAESVNVCTTNQCINGGQCVDGVCSCPVGFAGKHCERISDPCNPDPCLNGGLCYHHEMQFNCLCLPGFTGKRCEMNINECFSGPCLNTGICVDGINNFSCNCLPGFSGSICQIDIDECQSHPCSNGGFCEDGINQFSCICRTGFGGDRCQNVDDPCLQNPCVRGECFSSGSEFVCECPVHFTGIYCEQPLQLELGGSQEEYIQLPVGGNLVLNCSVSSASHQNRYNWSKLSSCGGPVESHTGPMYHHQNVSVGDYGTYLCNVTDYNGSVVTKVFHLSVTTKHVIDSCTLDDGNLGFWTQYSNDRFDWTLKSGPTLTAGTGPNNDHTLGTDQGKYLYIKSSTPRIFGEYASLVSQLLPANHSICFEFWYFMYGSGVGRLLVHSEDSCLQKEKELFKREGDQGERWNKASLSIQFPQIPNDYRLIITADVGTSYQGDIAIDDLVLLDGVCTDTMAGPSVIG